MTAGRMCACWVEGELATLTLEVQGSRELCHGRLSVASQGLTFPSALENQAAKCLLGRDEPLAGALPAPFLTGVVAHLPAPVGCWLPTP